jgi:hypothetical protein
MEGEPPINVNIPEQTIDNSPRSIKKRKTQDSINQSIFQFTTPQEAAITKSLLSSFNTRSASLCLKTSKSSAYVNINLSKDDLNTLSAFSEIPITLELEVGDEKIEKVVEKPLFFSEDYLYHCLESSKYSGLLRHQGYEKINDSLLKVLNQDWKNKSHYRIASGQLLAGAILVDGRQILLINCIELYNRKPSMDAHYERFGTKFMDDSTPDFTNKYEGINVVSKIEDRSRKLIIGTMVFNALVTSSLRLDKDNAVPEVGASTYEFTPSKETSLYISLRSMKAALETISKKAEISNPYDLDSQLRQVRSYLISPTSYICSRFSSEWTDALPFRPYTIFTLIEKSSTEASLDYMVASSILLKIADCMRFKNGVMEKDVLKEVVVGESETNAKKILTQIFDLYGNQDTLNLIGNRELEEILVELAKIATKQLKPANESIKLSIMERMKKAFN